jgi:hypothetical protein
LFWSLEMLVLEVFISWLRKILPQTQKRTKKAKKSLFLPILPIVFLIFSWIRIIQSCRVSIKNPAKVNNS